MRLTPKEQEHLENGELTIERKVRVRAKTGRELGCSIEVGDAVKVAGNYLAVRSVGKRRTGPELSPRRVRAGERQAPAFWVIEFEEVGKWAVREPEKTPVSPEVMEKVMNDVQRGSKVLVWPAVDENAVTVPCPVEKGQRIPVPGVPIIEIENVTRKLPAGRKAEWHATFVRHEVDRPQLLRRVPSGLASSVRDVVGMSESEKARRDGEYTSSLALSLGKEEPESVGADWTDPNAAEREVQRQMDRRDIMKQEDDLLKAATRLKQVGKQSSRKGRDLTPLLRDIFDRLAEEERELRDAA